MKLEKFSWDWFGEARAITVTKEKTTIVDGKGTEEAINGRIENLQNQIDNSNTPFETEQLQNRLAKMVGGVSIIHVGGYNQTELNEKKDRVDDALNATQAALSEGIVPGGGIALLNARRAITWPQDEEGISLESIGANIVWAACAMPFEQILTNAGYNGSAAQSYSDKLEKTKSDWDGFNIETDGTNDFKKVGIIDPLKVTRTALENAAAVAGTVLLTECVVVEEPNENNTNPLNGMY
jgi:chaperonin GroEL